MRPAPSFISPGFGGPNPQPDAPAGGRRHWTLRADPIAADRCIFRTETRAVATDRAARAAFRPYWACASPGILLVRRLLGSLIQAEAERRASASAGRCAAKLGVAGLCGDVECRP
jgi:hypothetical protein